MATDWAKIGNALTGFGAGLTGQGPQWQAIQAQNQIAQQNQQLRQREFDRLSEKDRREVEQARRMAFFQDFAAIMPFMEKGDFSTPAMIFDYRQKNLRDLGAEDTEETDMMMNLFQRAQAGDQEAAKMARDFARSIADWGMAAGVLPRPETKFLSENDVINGQVISIGPDGRPVATAVEGFQAPAQERKTAVVNGVLVDTQTGAPIYEAPREIDYNKPFLPDGTPNVAYQEYQARMSGNNMSNREAQIQDYMNLYGLSRAEAVARLDSRTLVDPVSGNLVVYDQTQGTATMPSVQIPSAQAPRPEAPKFSAEDLSFDPAKGTGFGSWLVSAYNATAGQLPFMPVATGREDAAQLLRVLDRDLVNAFATSSRPAVVEQEQIRKMIPQALDPTQNPEIARRQVTDMVNLLTAQYIDDKRYAENQQNPIKLREESGRRANEVERILARIVRPDAAQQLFSAIDQSNQLFARFNSLSDDELQSIDPSSLSDQELDMYIDRLQKARNSSGR